MNAAICNELYSKFTLLDKGKGFYYEIIDGEPYISDIKILEIANNFEFPNLYNLISNVNQINYLDINNFENNLKKYDDIIKIIHTDYDFLKPKIEIIDNDFIDEMFDEIYYGKIIWMIEMCKANIAEINGYKYKNLISNIIYYKVEYAQFDPNDDPDELNIYNMGLKVLVEFITLIYMLNVISGNQNNIYDLTGFKTYRYKIKPINLKKMLSILQTIHEKYEEYKPHLDSIISMYYKIKSKYEKLIKSLVQL